MNRSSPSGRGKREDGVSLIRRVVEGQDPKFSLAGHGVLVGVDQEQLKKEGGMMITVMQEQMEVEEIEGVKMLPDRRIALNYLEFSGNRDGFLKLEFFLKDISYQYEISLDKVEMAEGDMVNIIRVFTFGKEGVNITTREVEGQEDVRTIAGEGLMEGLDEEQLKEFVKRWVREVTEGLWESLMEREEVEGVTALTNGCCPVVSGVVVDVPLALGNEMMDFVYGANEAADREIAGATAGETSEEEEDIV